MPQAGKSKKRLISAMYMDCRDKLTPFRNRKEVSVPVLQDKLNFTEKELPLQSMDLLALFSGHSILLNYLHLH